PPVHPSNLRNIPGRAFLYRISCLPIHTFAKSDRAEPSPLAILAESSLNQVQGLAAHTGFDCFLDPRLLSTYGCRSDENETASSPFLAPFHATRQQLQTPLLLGS